jgi:hypothetical protein
MKEAMQAKRTHRTRSDISGFPTLNYVIQGLHDLFFGGVTIKPMDLQDIQISPEPGDTGINGIEDVLPGKPNPIDHNSIVYTHPRKHLDWAQAFWVFWKTAEAFRHDDYLFARDFVLSQGLAYDSFCIPEGVDVGLDFESADIWQIWDREIVTVSQVLIPTSNACLIIGKACSSGSVQASWIGSPNDMVPRMTLETFRPDFPNLG